MTEDLPSHHIQQELCTTRPLYRQGRKLTAVKVYTINNESQHLLIYNIPALKLTKELKSECLKYGELKQLRLITKYKTEPFTECYHAHYERIQSARVAKNFLDNKSFYGEFLHVCYAPEYETVADTRAKLKQREKDVLSRLEPGPSLSEYINFKPEINFQQMNRKRKHPALPITEERLKYESLHSNNKNVHLPHKRLKVEYGPEIPDNFTLQTSATTNLLSNENRNVKRIVFRNKTGSA